MKPKPPPALIVLAHCRPRQHLPALAALYCAFSRTFSVLQPTSTMVRARDTVRHRPALTHQATISSYIPLGSRSIWEGIDPIPQNDGPNPLVAIMYAQECEFISVYTVPELTTDRDAMDYFRAVSAAEEYSERALELTETIIRQNPAHYTVWCVGCPHCRSYNQTDPQGLSPEDTPCSQEGLERGARADERVRAGQLEELPGLVSFGPAHSPLSPQRS